MKTVVTSGKSGAFSAVHPAAAMVYFLAVLLISMFCFHPVLQVEMLVGAALFCITLQKRGEALREIGFYLPLFLMVAVTNPLFSHNGVTPLFFLNGNPVTLEALLYGVSLAVSVIGVLLWCKCCGRVMTEDKFLYLFGKLIPKLSLILSMALRFVPVYLRQSRRVIRARKAMGLFSGKGITDRVKNRMRVFVAMISWSLEHAMETSASMRARGYGQKGRTNFSLFRFSPADGVLLCGCVFLLAVVWIGRAAGFAAFSYYPRTGGIGAAPADLAVYAAFGLLSLLPFLLEVKEVIVWSCCVSKI